MEKIKQEFLSHKWINALGIIVALVLITVVGGYFFLKHDLEYIMRGVSPSGLLIWTIFIFIGCVANLAIGALPSIIANGFKSVKFVFVQKSNLIICVSLMPQMKSIYILTQLLPIVVLGLLPMIYGVVVSDIFVALFGAVMLSSSMTGVLLTARAMKYPCGTTFSDIAESSNYGFSATLPSSNE